MSQERPNWRTRFARAWRNAFDLHGPPGPLTARDHEVLGRLARGIVRRRMAMPAVMLLQSIKPLNALGSQAMTFLRPFALALFKQADYDRLTEILERRESIEVLLRAIESAQAEETQS